MRRRPNASTKIRSPVLVGVRGRQIRTMWIVQEDSLLVSPVNSWIGSSWRCFGRTSIVPALHRQVTVPTAVDSTNFKILVYHKKVLTFGCVPINPRCSLGRRKRQCVCLGSTGSRITQKMLHLYHQGLTVE